MNQSVLREICVCRQSKDKKNCGCDIFRTASIFKHKKKKEEHIYYFKLLFLQDLLKSDPRLFSGTLKQNNNKKSTLKYRKLGFIHFWSCLKLKFQAIEISLPKSPPIPFTGSVCLTIDSPTKTCQKYTIIPILGCQKNNGCKEYDNQKANKLHHFKEREESV